MLEDASSISSEEFPHISPRQRRIINYLDRLVGPGAQVFYIDACRLMEQKRPFRSTTHLVSHLLREIESALRDTLEPLCEANSYTKKSGEERHKEEILAILKALDIPSESPVAKAWIGLTGKENAKALDKWAHRNSLEPPRTCDSEFQDFWSNMEIILDTVLGCFESNYLVINKQLDELREKNQPGENDAKFLRNHIPNNFVAINYFFKQLTNPNWLLPLSSEGFFLLPPEPIENKEEGTISYPQWPQSQYLCAMAAQEPELVSRIILEIETKNSTVQAELMDAITRFRPEISARHTEQICLWLKNPTFFMGKKVGQIVSHLAKGKEIDSAGSISREFLYLLPQERLNTKDTDDESQLLYKRPQSRVDSWEYVEFLNSNFLDFLHADPQCALMIVIQALEEAINLSGAISTETYRDYSEYWRPAIENHEQNHGHDDVRNSLINVVRISSECCIDQDPHCFENILNKLKEKQWVLFRRIAIHILRIYGNNHINLVEKYIFNKKLFLDSEVFHEYIRLVQDYFSKLNKEKQQEFLEWVKEESIIVDGDNNVKSKELWLFRWLTILKGQLDNQSENLRLLLHNKYGELEHPDLLAYSSGIMVGPTSPLSTDKLKNMTVDEITQYIRNWEQPHGFTMESPEGVSRALSAVIAEDPMSFSFEAEKFMNCDPTYVHGVFEGFIKALDNKNLFEWQPVLNLMSFVVRQNKDIPGRNTDNSWDLDPDWGWTRTEIARLLERGFKFESNPVPYACRDQVFEILLHLTEDPNPSPEEDSNSSMDPATNSLNTTRGTAFHALISYAIWKKESLQKLDLYFGEKVDFSDMPEVLAVLEKHLDLLVDSSTTIRAVYGMQFSNLAFLDHDWAISNKGRIFQKNEELKEYWSAAWGSFIGFNMPKNWLIQDLLSEYQFAVSMAGSPSNQPLWGDNPDERLVEHIVHYYAWGKIELNSVILEMFWRKSTQQLREHAINFIGRTVQGVSSEIVNRFKELWENRFNAISKFDNQEPYYAELNAFGWWLISEQFDNSWCISQLGKVLKKTGEVENDQEVLERLVTLACEYPLEIIEITEMMVNGDAMRRGIYLWTNNIKKIINCVLPISNEQVQKATKELINRLAARGYSNFESLIQ